METNEAQPIIPPDRLRRPVNSNYKGIPTIASKSTP